MADKENHKNVCQVVRGDTAAEIEAQCAEKVPGWDKLSPETKAEVVALQARFWELTTGPAYGVEAKESGGYSVGPQGNATVNTLRLMDAFGTSDMGFIDARINDLITHFGANNSREMRGADLAADLTFIAGGKAGDPVQAALLTQMTATHDAAMRALKMIGQSDWVDQAQMFGNLSTKLLNAYTRQAETLRKLQKGGEQTVRHVHVDNRGGQAVFTEQVNQTGGVPRNVESQAQEQHSPCDGSAAMLGYDPAWHGLPATSSAREETVCTSRREVDGAEGSDG